MSYYIIHKHEVAYGLSMGTKIGDNERAWTAHDRH